MNRMQKGLIFSLDAFVAFTLALVAIYSLIFFSSIPSGYYASLTQAHLLAKDTLQSLSSTSCWEGYEECTDDSVSILQHIVFRSHDKDGSVRTFIGQFIPNQFGYKFEILEDGFVYDTASPEFDAIDDHNNKLSRLSVSSYAVVFQHRSKSGEAVNPYKYKTCTGDIDGERDLCALPASNYRVPEFDVKTVKLTVYI